MARLNGFVLALLGALAIGLVGASGAIAAAPTLHLTHQGSPLLAGDAFRLEANHGLTVSSKSGGAECPTPSAEDGFSGVDLTNNSTKDAIELKSATGSLFGGVCTSTFSIGPEAELFAAYNGQGESSRPLGTLTLTSKLKAEFAVPTGVQTLFELFFPHENPELNSYCLFAYKKLKGTIATGTPLTVSFTKQKLKLLGGEDKRCPKVMELTVAFEDTYFQNESGSQLITGAVL